eukprot:3542156-Ditylum_brightwellii.AAC.1
MFHNQFLCAVNSAKENAGVSNDTFTAWQAEVCAGFISRKQYSLSDNWNDEPELEIKPFAKATANQAVVLDAMSKKLIFSIRVTNTSQDVYTLYFCWSRLERDTL